MSYLEQLAKTSSNCTLNPQGIVHGDLTARNVMLVSLGRAGVRHAHGHRGSSLTPSSPRPSPGRSPAACGRPSNTGTGTGSGTGVGAGTGIWTGSGEGGSTAVLSTRASRISFPGDGGGGLAGTWGPGGGGGGGAHTGRRGVGMAAEWSSVGSTAGVFQGAPAAAAGAGGGASSVLHAFGPRHVCHVSPSAAASTAPSSASYYVSTMGASNRTTAGGGGGGGGDTDGGDGDGGGGCVRGPLGSSSSTAGGAAQASALGKPWKSGAARAVAKEAGIPQGPTCGGCGRCFVAKVADFGLSRTLDTQSKILTKTTGTVGGEGKGGQAGRCLHGKSTQPP